MAEPSKNTNPVRKLRSAFPALDVESGSKIWVAEVPPKFDFGETKVLLRKNLKHWIRKRGYTTYEQFAYECALPKSTLSQILNQTRDPKLGTLEQFAKVLGLNVADLLTPPAPLPKDWAEL